MTRTSAVVSAKEQHPLLTAVAKAQSDLDSAQAKLAEVRRQVAALDLAQPPEHRCRCGLPFRSERRLAEHVYLSHNGPEPEHWLSSETLAAPAAAAAEGKDGNA